MKLITRDTDYAIRALSYIARNGRGLVSVKDLAERLKVPHPFLRQILQALTRGKIVHSYKGKGGGFMLARKPRTIHITDLINIFQGGLKFNQCMLKRSICPDKETCQLKKKLDKMERLLSSELKSITVASLMKEARFRGKAKNH